MSEMLTRAESAGGFHARERGFDVESSLAVKPASIPEVLRKNDWMEGAAMVLKIVEVKVAGGLPDLDSECFQTLIVGAFALELEK